MVKETKSLEELKAEFSSLKREIKKMEEKELVTVIRRYCKLSDVKLGEFTLVCQKVVEEMEREKKEQGSKKEVYIPTKPESEIESVLNSIAVPETKVKDNIEEELANVKIPEEPEVQGKDELELSHILAELDEFDDEFCLEEEYCSDPPVVKEEEKTRKKETVDGRGDKDTFIF